MKSRLSGRKLLLTRSAEDSAAWADTLRGEGAEPIVFPCITAEASSDPNLKAAIETILAQTDWLVFTSRRGVDAFADLVDSPLPETVKLAAVGNATAKSCREHFGRVDRVGSGTAEVLANELAAAESIRGAKCLLALAANAGNLLERTLTEAGAIVKRFDVYRTVPSKRLEPKQTLSSLGSDTVIFASPSAVTGFDNQIDVDIDQQFVTIGPSTSAAVRARRWDIAAEAKEPSLSGIIESMTETDYV
jgi:uroporphyrinogen-III synthase